MTRERATGILTLGLLLAWDDWVHRRIESVELKDPLRFMRRVSLDFGYPDTPAAEYSPDGEPIIIIPLTFLRKRALLNFSLCDEGGRVLPLLTRTQNANVAAAVLVAYAEWKADEAWEDETGERILSGHPVPQSIRDHFFKIAVESRDDAERSWERLGNPPQSWIETDAGGRPTASQWRELMVTDPAFMALARDFAFNYLALTPLVGDVRRRRVVKFRHEVVEEAPVSRLRVRIRERRARREARRSVREADKQPGPRGRLRVSAWLESDQACSQVKFRVTSNRVDCTFERKDAGTLDVQLPVGAYEVRAVVPEGLSQIRPGPVDVTISPGDEQQIRFDYISAVREDPRSELRDREARPGLLTRIATGLAWRPKRVVVVTPAVGTGGSYHFEAEAPEGLFVSRVALTGAGTPASDGNNESNLLALDKNRERVHLATSAVPQDKSGIVTLQLRPRPWTVVRPACLSAIFTTCVLFAVARRWPAIGTNAGAVATLLLIVPGGLSAWAARSQENPVTTEVLFGLRLLSLASGLWAFVGAATLVLNRRYDAEPDGTATLGEAWSGTEPLLWTLFGLSVVTAVALLIAWRQLLWLPENRSRKRRSQETPGDVRREERAR